MKRLTIKDKDGDVALNCNECSNDGSTNCDIENCYLTAICRLTSIEDILGDDYNLKVLAKLLQPKVETNMYDQEEIIEDCTVQILTNTATGETSIGWWHGSAEDMPGKEHDHG